MSTDLSLMDFLFERDDPILNLSDKDPFGKITETWPTNPDEFLDSFLKFDDHLGILDDDEMFTDMPDAIDISVANSSCSDSGLSSDQQLSPMVQDDDEDNGDFQPSTSGSEGSPNPHYYTCSVDSPMVEEEIEIDSSVYDLSDTETLGDIIVDDDNEAIIEELSDTQDSKETITLHTVKSNAVHKLIRVTPVSGNPRSILLPVSLTDMKDIRAIKILNSGTRKGSSNSLSKSISKGTATAVSSKNTSEDESDTHYPRLQLTTEEKRLLQKEGVRLPSHYPLTKYEERELKRIRRKIRNKISAQDSRKRKKDYIDGLEDRVKQCTEENMSLVKKIKVLQSQNQTMMTQLKRLHAALSRGTAKTAQPATCLMVLMLSVALVMMPNLGANKNSDVQAETEISLPENDIPPIAGRSRTLLFSKPEDICLQSEAQIKIEEISMLADMDDQSHFHSKVKVEENNMYADMDELLHFHRDHDDHDYGPPIKRLKREPVEYLQGSTGFIIPSLDDDWPPPKSHHLSDKTNEITNKINDYANEMKINISDTTGTRTVVLQVPNEK